jgi:hypothetical protein
MGRTILSCNRSRSRGQALDHQNAENQDQDVSGRHFLGDSLRAQDSEFSVFDNPRFRADALI